MAIFNERQCLMAVPGRFDCDFVWENALVYHLVEVYFIESVAQLNVPTVQADEPRGLLFLERLRSLRETNA